MQLEVSETEQVKPCPIHLFFLYPVKATMLKSSAPFFLCFCFLLSRSWWSPWLDKQCPTSHPNIHRYAWFRGSLVLQTHINTFPLLPLTLVKTLYRDMWSSQVMKKTHYYLVDTSVIIPGAAVSELEFKIIHEDQPFMVKDLKVSLDSSATMNDSWCCIWTWTLCF